MKRSTQDSQTKASSDQLTNSPRSHKKLMKSGGEKARDTTKQQEDNRTETYLCKERLQQTEKDLRKQLQITSLQKKEIKQLEVKNFKLTNKYEGISTKLQESDKRIQELEGQLKNTEQTLADKSYSLFTEIGRRRELAELVQSLKGFKERALDAEKQVKELTDDNQKLKLQLDASILKASTFKNESETLKVELKKQSDVMRAKQNTIGNLKTALDAKQKIIEAHKEEIKRQRKAAQETEVEVKRNRQIEETTLKRIKHKDEENLSLRKEVTSLHKSLYDFEMKLSKLDLQYQILQEKSEQAHTDKAILEKKNHTLEISTASLEREAVETQTLLEKSQQENELLKNQVEQVKIKLAETIQSSKDTRGGRSGKNLMGGADERVHSGYAEVREAVDVAEPER
ncbi:cilia- and flagella-associated protein 58-like [Xiphophorus couchianus]|uniref:cilia- and flagella-associated protein 58-like n=1 Tax=Xiphophorus couchianus TaxID=32473 RepID=UPI001015CD99|nr:cilia- and flagella-associated protein 58-like [Xiphophorus couchianus]